MSNIEKSAPDTGTEPAAQLGDEQPVDAQSDLARSAGKSLGKTVWTGAAVGIGSAAIVAALLYARKRN